MIETSKPTEEELIETSEPTEGDLSDLTMFPSNPYEEELIETSEPTEEDLSDLTVSGKIMLSMRVRLDASLERNKAFEAKIAALEAELAKAQ